MSRALPRALPRALAVLAGTLLAACASRPPEAVPEAEPALPPIAPASPHAAFEQKQRDRAMALGRDGRLAEAAQVWEVLSLLRPDQPDYRERLADTRRQIDTAVAERWQRAQAASRRGDADAAVAASLGVLALQPGHVQAADTLRALERERVRRTHLGKLSRLTLTRRAISEAEMAPVAASPRSDPGNEIEHASMLAGAGEFDDAIALLERRLSTNPRDDAARRMLADLYVQKVQSQPGLDPAVASRSLERSLKLDPSNAAAKARLAQLRVPARAVPPKVAASAAAR